MRSCLVAFACVVVQCSVLTPANAVQPGIPALPYKPVELTVEPSTIPVSQQVTDRLHKDVALRKELSETLLQMRAAIQKKWFLNSGFFGFIMGALGKSHLPQGIQPLYYPPHNGRPPGDSSAPWIVTEFLRAQPAHIGSRAPLVAYNDPGQLVLSYSGPNNRQRVLIPPALSLQETRGGVELSDAPQVPLVFIPELPAPGAPIPVHNEHKQRALYHPLRLLDYVQLNKTAVKGYRPIPTIVGMMNADTSHQMPAQTAQRFYPAILYRESVVSYRSRNGEP